MKKLVFAPPLFAAALIAVVGTAAERAVPPHLAAAIDLALHVNLANTSYRHAEPMVQWTGTCQSHTDCSGFLNSLLGHTYGYGKEDFKRWFDSRRPTAARYHDAIVEERGFLRIAHVNKVRPGDFLAVNYFNSKENTGHVMLVAEAPKRMPAKRPVVGNLEQWQVTVIDSSSSGHGPSDTRHHRGAGGNDHDGLGIGVLRLYTNSEGKVAGFAWSTFDKSTFKRPSEEHLVIGRLTPGLKP
jgi:hypothetical protein